MQNGIFTLNWAAVGDAVLTAVVAAVVIGLVSVVSTSGFNLFTTNWVMVGQSMANLGAIAGVLTLGKSFLSTNTGSVLNVGPTAASTLA